MNSETSCHCSKELLQISLELQRFQAIVDADFVLNLIHRLCQQGKSIVQCAGCSKVPHTPILAIPKLFEQFVPLLEALCSAYDISIHPGFFDSAMLCFEQPPATFVCVRSKVVFGQTELDDDESRLLVRALLGRTLFKLVELTECLKSKLSVMLDEPQAHVNGTTTTLKSCQSSAETIISRLIGLIQVVEGECDSTLLG